MNDNNEKMEVFNSTLQQIFDKYVPLITVRLTKSKTLWLTNEIKNLIKGYSQGSIPYKSFCGKTCCF